MRELRFLQVLKFEVQMRLHLLHQHRRHLPRDSDRWHLSQIDNPHHHHYLDLMALLLVLLKVQEFLAHLDTCHLHRQHEVHYRHQIHRHRIHQQIQHQLVLVM